MSERSTRVRTGDGWQPRIKVQGGYVPSGSAVPPKPPKGGSSFKPATSQAKPKG